MPEYLSIHGGERLRGDVRISGAKNAALPLLLATLLSAEESRIRNVPDLDDICVTLRLLQSLGARTEFAAHEVVVRADTLTCIEAPYALVKAMRASFWVLGPLLARAREAHVALPGGDAIGTRPVDLHLQGLTQLGADIRIQHGVVIASAQGGLRPGKVELAYPSVGATHQLLMAAALIEGESVLIGAAREPEVVALANFLISMGASIEGAGTQQIVIRGREQLGGGTATVLGDRIEAATYLVSGAMTGGSVTVNGVEQGDLKSMLALLADAGCVVSEQPGPGGTETLVLSGPDRLSPLSFETAPFPGVATDVQPLLLAAATRADGISHIVETVFENRFGHVSQFAKFGADIKVAGRGATVRGVKSLKAATVDAGDIRAAAALVLMGLAAQGETIVREIHHLDRGYERLVEKLKSLGAIVKRSPRYEEHDLVVGC